MNNVILIFFLKFSRVSVDQALVPYSNGIDSFPQRAAGNDFGMVYGDSSGETPYSSGMQIIDFFWKNFFVRKCWEIQIIFANYTAIARFSTKFLEVSKIEFTKGQTKC